MKAFFIIGLVLFWTAGNAEFVLSADVKVSSLGTSDEAGTSESGNGRVSPIEEFEDKSDTALQTAIPSYLIGLWGHTILVEKSTQKLYLYDKDYTLIKTFHVTTGQNQGDKRGEGDRKTPEGIYFFIKVKEQKELLSKYGVMALPINYPNFIDTIQRKKGNGIWLHATDDPSRPVKPFDSKGCVVTANEDILELADYIKLQTTPMVIVDKIEYDSAEKIADTRKEIENLMEKWQDSWQKKDIAGYMGAYSKKLRTNGMDFQRWKQYKENLNRQYRKIQISVSDMKILRHRDHIVVSFVQHYKSDQENSLGIKRLYLSHEENDWKIIGEEWSSLPTQAPAMIAKKYTAVKLAKLEPMPPPIAGDNKAVLQKVNFEIAKEENQLPPTPSLVKEGVTKSGELFSDKIDIEDFAIVKQNAASRVTFRLVNKTKERQILSGRLAIVAANKKDENVMRYSSYPFMPLEQGAPKDFKNGEWYSIRRFKIVRGMINENITAPVTVLVYSTAGELLLQKEFPAQAGATSTVFPVAHTATKLVSLHGFRIKKENDRLAISFNLVRTAANGTTIARGYVFIVGDYGDTYFTFPKDRKVTDGLPADFKKGDTFAIRWQKHIRQSLPYSLNDPVKMISVFVFSADGELLSKKEERM